MGVFVLNRTFAPWSSQVEYKDCMILHVWSAQLIVSHLSRRRLGSVAARSTVPRPRSGATLSIVCTLGGPHLFTTPLVFLGLLLLPHRQLASALLFNFVARARGWAKLR